VCLSQKQIYFDFTRFNDVNTWCAALFVGHSPSFGARQIFGGAILEALTRQGASARGFEDGAAVAAPMVGRYSVVNPRLLGHRVAAALASMSRSRFKSASEDPACTAPTSNDDGASPLLHAAFDPTNTSTISPSMRPAPAVCGTLAIRDASLLAIPLSRRHRRRLMKVRIVSSAAAAARIWARVSPVAALRVLRAV
jgi:hypothetical protein